MKVSFKNIEFHVTINCINANGYFVEYPNLSPDNLDCSLMSLKTGPVLLDHELCEAIDEARDHVNEIFSDLVKWTKRNERPADIARAAIEHIADEIDTCYLPGDPFSPIADAIETGSRIEATVKSKLFSALLRVENYVLRATIIAAGEQFGFTRDYSC